MANSVDLAETVRAKRLRIVAALSARFGDVELAENAFAEACVRAAATRSPPRDWAAWLYAVAQRIAVDSLRHSRVVRAHAEAAASFDEEVSVSERSMIPDRRLALFFACCHPAIDIASRVALALSTICGFSAKQISRACLLSPAAVSQRLVRAKKKLADSGIMFEIPDSRFFAERLEAVLCTIEIAYSQAHASSDPDGEQALLARQTLELVDILATLMPGNAQVNALAAALWFSEARRPARRDTAGKMIPLEDQDPQLWDRSMLARAREYYGQVDTAQDASLRTLQADIQALWCSRRRQSDPAPWNRVLARYDRMIAIRDSAFIRLNRVVAIHKLQGAAAALREFEELPCAALEGSPAYHAVGAELLSHTQRVREAIQAYDTAIGLQEGSAERAWLIAQRDALILRTPP